MKWEQTTVDLKPAIGDKEAVAHFKYQNVGKAPVQVNRSGLPAAAPRRNRKKTKSNPAIKAKLPPRFNIGDRTGQQVKTVTVETDDSVQPRTILTLKTDIPELLKLQPNFVYWQAGRRSQTKTIVATAGKDVPIKKLDVSSLNPQFKAKVEPGGPRAIPN